jgi:hypothetical protein
MNKPIKDNRMIENELAEFTDQILDESSTLDKIPLTPDPKLRALEQTVLQLKNTFKEDGPSEAVIQRMRQNIVMQWKQQESNVSLPFWKKLYSLFKPDRQKWQSQRTASAGTWLYPWQPSLADADRHSPLNKVSSSQPAASGQNLNVSVVAAFGG